MDTLLPYTPCFRSESLGYFGPDAFFYLGTDVSAGDVADRYAASDRAFNNILHPRKRHLAAAKLNYAVSDATLLFAHVQFARVDTLSVQRPASFDDAAELSFFHPAPGRLEFTNGVGNLDSANPLVTLFA